MNYELDELDELILHFEKHSIEFQKQNKIHKEKYPHRILTYDSEFDLPNALATICKEIANLKTKL